MTSAPEVPKFVQTMTEVPMMVGLIVNSWAKLEHAMVPMTNRLLRTADDNVAKIVVFATPAAARADLLLALSAIAPLPDEWKLEIKQFFAEYDRLRRARNDVAHGFFSGLDENEDYVLRSVKWRREYRESIKPEQKQSLVKTYNEIEKLVGNAGQIAHQLRHLWPSTAS